MAHFLAVFDVNAGGFREIRGQGIEHLNYCVLPKQPLFTKILGFKGRGP